MKLRLSMLVIIICASLGFFNGSPVWNKSGSGIYESEIQKIFISPKDDTHIYAGTSRALYKSIDGGKSYRTALRLSGGSREVNDIFISGDYPQFVYAATDAGLYESVNEGQTWEKIYFSSEADATRGLSVARFGNQIYLGTQNGLFYKTGEEAQWRKIKKGIDKKAVYQMVGDNRFLYIATGQKVFRFEKGTQKIREIFALGIGKEAEFDEATDEVWMDDEGRPIRFIAASDSSQPCLFVASSQGIYFSCDQGKSWDVFARDHFDFGELTSMLIFSKNGISPGNCPQFPQKCWKIMASTEKGAFFLDNEQWTQVYKGMETNGINDLIRDAHGTVYAATDKGIFYLPVEKALPSLDGRTKQSMAKAGLKMNQEDLPAFDFEPSIGEVHQMAIDYAEVSHQKIKTWRAQARHKAWLPDLDVGVDSSRGWSSSDSIWGSYSGGGQHYVGPDDKTRKEDTGWDVSMSWDLGDLIWSSDQTSIDSRSKLMVELREDILNEVTRLYFERRRNQIDLALSDTADWHINMEKEMRVAELTALIDALTGGEFSREIERQRGREARSKK